MLLKISYQNKKLDYIKVYQKYVLRDLFIVQLIQYLIAILYEY